MNKGENYFPVSCALHSELELSIMQGKWLQLDWHDEEKSYRETLLPRDIITREQQEFLLAETRDGTQHRIRLDYIDSGL